MRISDVAQGPGWWLASDGKWYPPESASAGTPPQAPAAPPVPAPLAEMPVTARAVTHQDPSFDDATPLPAFGSPLPQTPAEPPQVTPAPVMPPAHVPGPARPEESGWVGHDLFAKNELTAAPTYHREVLTDRRAERDLRGAVCGLASAVALAFTFLYWYQLSAQPGGLVRHMTVYSPAFRGWYLLVPAGAGLTLLLAIGNFVLRPGASGAVAVFIMLRLLALATMVVTVTAILVHHPSGLPAGPGGASVGVRVLWPALVSGAATIVALLGTLASGASLRG